LHRLSPGRVIGACGAASPASEHANRARAQAACSNATLTGTYGAQNQGYSLAGADGTALASPAPLTAINLLTLDGNGNISRTGTQNTGGTVTPNDLSGTYSVNADCTFSIIFKTASGGLNHVSGVITNGGAEAFVTAADPGRSVATASWKRQ
jgi:hypothetical protein